MDKILKSTTEVTSHEKNDNGISVASGTYIYSFKAGKYNLSKKLMLVK